MRTTIYYYRTPNTAVAVATPPRLCGVSIVFNLRGRGFLRVAVHLFNRDLRPRKLFCSVLWPFRYRVRHRYRMVFLARPICLPESIAHVTTVQTNYQSRTTCNSLRLDRRKPCSSNTCTRIECDPSLYNSETWRRKACLTVAIYLLNGYHYTTEIYVFYDPGRRVILYVSHNHCRVGFIRCRARKSCFELCILSIWIVQ